MTYLPVPDGCFTTDELRAALVVYHFRWVASCRRQINSITGEFGPSKPTLHRQHPRLVAALELAVVSTEPKAEDEKAQMALMKRVAEVAAAITFPKQGRPTFFMPDEERLLLEMLAQLRDVA